MKKVYIILFLIILLGFFLRFYKIKNTSLFGDELDFGYQAYSLVTTGRDYSGNFMPLYFKSLSEWKNGVLIYSIAPFIKIFGVGYYGIRIPAIIFGTLTILFVYLLVKELLDNEFLGLTSAFVLAILPWHIHYSRVGIESSEMLFAYVAGFYFFVKSFKTYKLLPISAFLFAVSFAIYRTQIIFIPLTVAATFWIYRKETLKISKKYLIIAAMVFVAIAGPYFYEATLGHGAERFASISIFNWNIVNNTVGIARDEDKMLEGNSFVSNLSGKFLHNKYGYLIGAFSSNFLQAYSTEFLFISGDPNLRQGIPGFGELYKYDFILLVAGVLFFTDFNYDKKARLTVIALFFLAPIASALTSDGGNHATRLYMMVLPLTILIAYGIYCFYYRMDKGLLRSACLSVLGIFMILSFSNFIHNYFVHYPVDSEKWWQSGFEEATKLAISKGANYDKVIISSADEPAQAYFLAWSSYSPLDFQKTGFSKPFRMNGFGEVTKLGKYVFPSIGSGVSLYDLPKELPKGYLYIATYKEINLDLVQEPWRLPKDLVLVDTVKYPSGKPAFYLLTKD